MAPVAATIAMHKAAGYAVVVWVCGRVGCLDVSGGVVVMRQRVLRLVAVVVAVVVALSLNGIAWAGADWCC